MQRIGQPPPPEDGATTSRPPLRTDIDPAAIADAANDDDHAVPLSGPHDYETRVKSYLQSLKAYIEGASVKRKPPHRDDDPL